MRFPLPRALPLLFLLVAAFNYVYDPLVVVGVQTLGTAIQSRFLEEGNPGATSRSGPTTPRGSTAACAPRRISTT